jgi:Cys-tRNA(Pro)/Cys-tRNA(Cys) deacylase
MPSAARDSQLPRNINVGDLAALLRRLGRRARLVNHPDLAGGGKTAAQFAEAVRYQPERVAKTLQLRVCQQGARGHRPHAAVLLAAPDRVDLDAVGAILDADRVRLASRRELQNALGVAPGAVSPFWLGAIPVHIDVSLLAESTVFVGTGAPGIELEIAPAELRDVTRAAVRRYRLRDDRP